MRTHKKLIRKIRARYGYTGVLKSEPDLRVYYTKKPLKNHDMTYERVVFYGRLNKTKPKPYTGWDTDRHRFVCGNGTTPKLKARIGWRYATYCLPNRKLHQFICR